MTIVLIDELIINKKCKNVSSKNKINLILLMMENVYFNVTLKYYVFLLKKLLGYVFL